MGATRSAAFSRASRIRALVIVAVAGSALLALRCADVARGLGQACIRGEDCQSGVCAGSVCVGAPATFDSGLPDASAVDAAPEAAPVKADAHADVHVSMEATVMHMDAKRPTDAPGDAVHRREAAVEAGEAGGDAIVPADAPMDAHADQAMADTGTPKDSGGAPSPDGSHDAHTG